MAQKAVKVTSQNRDELQSRFFNDGPGVPMSIGYWLVAYFGDDGDYDMLSPSTFNQTYNLGEKLRNGFYEVVPKELN